MCAATQHMQSPSPDCEHVLHVSCHAAGEYLPLMAPVVTEGRPEQWLGHVEGAMFAATKRALVRGLEESKGGASM
jgi:hypothetical protein